MIGVWFQIAKVMGLRYFLFRTKYELERKLGLLKFRYPANTNSQTNVNLSDWRQGAANFFFEDRNSIRLESSVSGLLESDAKDIFDGKLKFFEAETIDLGRSYDWITNPISGYRYDIKKHWSEIEDIDSSSGDIKYVWEKSRFSYLYTVIRYDHAFKTDSSRFVFNEIISWIDTNPLNYGPNYVSSQEICLRILNWTFALYYYKNSEHLTDIVFFRIISSIYNQLQHVYRNINFSRIAVRNNHALTETLTMYLAGLLFPFFPEAKKWKLNGKKWFEEEIEYQIYPDGTYLQFSMNYHRVVVQLLTWAFVLSKANGEKFSDTTYDRARKTLMFLLECQDTKTGRLPNYGANDGSLFFKLNDCEYRDFRPQLSALGFALDGKALYREGPWDEDIMWYFGITGPEIPRHFLEVGPIAQFDVGGFYVMRDENSLTFIRCGNHKDRPSQADNLHLDIWYKGNNILRDSGSFSYNTSHDLIRCFAGTQSHNTVMLGNFDQMKKGPRFIWLGWSQAVFAQVRELGDCFEFEGKIHAFKYVSKKVFHHRIIRKQKTKPQWEIIDILEHDTQEAMHQRWNVIDDYNGLFTIIAVDEKDVVIEPEIRQGWYSETYGLKKQSIQIVYSTQGKKIKTVISIKDSISGALQ